LIFLSFWTRLARRYFHRIKVEQRKKEGRRNGREGGDESEGECARIVTLLQTHNFFARNIVIKISDYVGFTKIEIICVCFDWKKFSYLSKWTQCWTHCKSDTHVELFDLINVINASKINHLNLTNHDCSVNINDLKILIFLKCIIQIFFKLNYLKKESKLQISCFSYVVFNSLPKK
jgi:hypothetical protein